MVDFYFCIYIFGTSLSILFIKLMIELKFALSSPDNLDFFNMLHFFSWE